VEALRRALDDESSWWIVERALGGAMMGVAGYALAAK
jgi:hypothetical protein